MMTDTQQTQSEYRRFPRRWFAVVCAVGLILLVGCKSNKDTNGNGSGVSRGKNDPLFASGPNLIPKQNMPIPDRATGPKGRSDPLTTPTGKPGEKIGYNDDPERFKGTYVPGKASTTAALANRTKDSDELKIEDGSVPLIPASGTLPGGTLEPPPEVTQLYAELDKLGIKREDRSLTRENNQWAFRASLVNTEGTKTQYTGVSDNPAEAVKQVLKQLK
jgi:hypothetical protein